MNASARLYNEYEKEIEGHENEHIDSAAGMVDYIRHSTAKYHGIYVRSCYIPKIFSKGEFKYLEEEINTLYGIFAKIINRYAEDDEYRKLFGFDERLEKLILNSDFNDNILPIARIDIFYNDETGEYKFCEFNTDGSSAMNEDRELNNALKDTKAYKEFAAKRKVETCELFDSWVEEFLEIYKKSSKSDELPNVAISDFMECATSNEFEIFRQAFEKRGITACICDIRELKYVDGILKTPDGTRIDAIYRRAVTSDIMKHYDEVQDVINAACDKKVRLIGDFFTQIIHNKVLYKIIHLPETLAMLTRKEQLYVYHHVPYTMMLSKDNIDDVIRNKDRWILKPEDSYGSKGVYAGVEYSQDEWEQKVRGVKMGEYILQEFCMPYTNYNYEFDGNSLNRIKFYNLTGMYVYNGKLKGMYSRISKSPIISTQYSEMAIPTIIVDET